jgi:hypothetical protein
MRRVTALLSAAAVVIASAGIFAQAKPSFAGKWTRDAAPAGDPAAGGGRGRGMGGGGLGQELTITQDATTLTIEYMGGGRNPAPQKLTYKLDGSESKNAAPGRGGAATELVSKAAWTGNTLVVTTTTPNGERKQVFSLDGGKLVVETTTPGREGGPGMTSKVTYSKSS